MHRFFLTKPYLRMKTSTILPILPKVAAITTAFSLLLSSPVAAETLAQRLAILERDQQASKAQIEQLLGEIERLKKATNADNTELQTSIITQTNATTELETAIADEDERIGSRAVVNAFEGMSLDVGGFLHSTLTHVDGEEGSVTSFNRQIFELLIRTEFNERWSAFIAQAFIREGSPAFDDDNDGVFNEPGERFDPAIRVGSNTPLVIGWTNYRHSDQLNIQFGRFITPHGIINIEHFPAILLDTEQPQFLRPFGGQTIFPNFVTGTQIHGTTYVNQNDSLSYNLYGANFVGNSDDFVFGGRVAYGFEDLGVKLGFNASTGERTSSVSSDYQLFGADLLIDKGALLWKTEYFRTNEDFGDDRIAFYTQPAWRFNSKWTAFYRYDFLDNGSDFGDSVEHMLGVNYTPLPNIRLRGTIAKRTVDSVNDVNTPNGISDFSEADTLLYQTSATLSF